MAGFKKLIFIQLISWLLFALLGGYFIALSFDSAVSDAQQKAQRVVNAYINTQTIEQLAPEKIQKAFADGSTFSKLVIRDQSGQVVGMVESSQSLPLFAEIVNNSFNSIRPQFAVNQTSDIKVEFTINAHNLARAC